VKNKSAQIKNFITIPNENGITSFKHFHPVRRAWRGRERRFHKPQFRESLGRILSAKCISTISGGRFDD
jgi:hypothetical protein